MLKKIKWTGFIAISSYIVTCISVFYLQKKMIYHPTKQHPENKKINKIYNSDGDLLALDFKTPNYNKTLIIFHGRDRNAGYRHYFFKIFGKKTRLIVIEYPGFGENHNRQMNKKNILRHCHETMSYVMKNVTGTITVVGESLGTGIASEMAATYNIEKLVLITPYSSLADLAKNKFWFLPTKTLLSENYESVSHLKNYKGKILFVISEKDKLIPPRFSKKLLNSVNTFTKELFVLDAGHSDWWDKMTNKQKNYLKNF